MSNIFQDPVTGRRFASDPVTGQSRWIDEPLPTPPNGPPTLKQSHRLRNSLIVVGVAVPLLGIIGALSSGSTTNTANTSAAPAPAATTVAPEVTPAPMEVATEPPAAEPVAYTPVPADFTIKLHILSKACFGSAGCNITYRIDPSYAGAPLTDDQAFEITYVVKGGEDGPQTNSFTMNGTNAQFDSEEFLSTSSSHAKLSARVTEVLSNN